MCGRFRGRAARPDPALLAAHTAALPPRGGRLPASTNPLPPVRPVTRAVGRGRDRAATAPRPPPPRGAACAHKPNYSRARGSRTARPIRRRASPPRPSRLVTTRPLPPLARAGRRRGRPPSGDRRLGRAAGARLSAGGR